MSGIPLVEFGPDHGQVHRPLDDLVVMTSLREKALTILDQIHSANPKQLPHNCFCIQHASNTCL